MTQEGFILNELGPIVDLEEYQDHLLKCLDRKGIVVSRVYRDRLALWEEAMYLALEAKLDLPGLKVQTLLYRDREEKKEREVQEAPVVFLGRREMLEDQESEVTQAVGNAVFLALSGLEAVMESKGLQAREEGREFGAKEAIKAIQVYRDYLLSYLTKSLED